MKKMISYFKGFFNYKRHKVHEDNLSYTLSSENTHWLTTHIAAILALTTVILSFALFFLLVFMPLQQEKKDIIIYILGVLSAIDTQVFSFFFGSSNDSETKNKTIQHQIMQKK